MAKGTIAMVLGLGKDRSRNCCKLGTALFQILNCWQTSDLQAACHVDRLKTYILGTDDSTCQVLRTRVNNEADRD